MRRALIFLPLLCACAHVLTPPGPPPLSQEADNFFAEADSDDNGGSIIVDLDAVRQLGFLKPAPAGQHSVWSDFVGFTLPQLAADLKNPADRDLMARAAVLFALFREWDGWPAVQRFGVMLPRTDDPDNAGERLLGLMAFEGTLETSRSLLAAIAASDQATGKPLFSARGDDLCVVRDGGPVWCIRPGPGYLAVGALPGLAAMKELLSGPRRKLPTPALIRARLNIPSLGKGFFALEPTNGILIRGAFATQQVALASVIEQKLLDGLDSIDAHDRAEKALIAPVLAETQKGLARDEHAPPSLKAAAARLNIDWLIDPDGTWAALRKSAKISREEGLVTVEAQIPETSVKRAVAEGSSVATFAIIGVFAAIAIPQFEKYQCESKQTEVETALTAAATAARQVRESGGKVDTLQSIGFVPPEKSRYTYCLGSACVPCQAQGCYQPAPEKNPCLRLAQAHDTTSKYRFLMCAVADLDDSPAEGDVDVWVVTDDGAPKHLQDDCK